MQKMLILLGVVLIVVGLGWPWLSKVPFGRLPGDIVIDKPTLKVYFPVTTMIIISLLLSLLMRFFNK
jgi:hypothetical protein